MSYRAAQEAQLLAEEKWIIDALTKIRLQRNCLQIERLHLESLKSKFYQKSSTRSNQRSDKQVQENGVQQPGTSFPKNDAASMRNSHNFIEFEVPIVTEETCNEEPLDLAVTKSVFNKDYLLDNMEEYEEDEDTCENIEVDINMLMDSNTGTDTG